MIHIIHNLGGCGGTLLSRCIGVLPGVALLSEINPASVKLFYHFDPLYQDKNWLRLLEPADIERFSQMDLGQVDAFRKLIDVFHTRASQAGRHLILRDYNFVDFAGIPYITNPPRELTLYPALPDGIPTRAIAFIRHPIDQWSSLCKHEHFLPVLTPSHFCESYMIFLEKLEGIPVFKYEEFVERPEAELRAICEALSLPFDPAFADQFHTFDYVSGDFARHQEKSISLPARKTFPPQVLGEFRSSDAFWRILRATNYAAPDDSESPDPEGTVGQAEA